MTISFVLKKLFFTIISIFIVFFIVFVIISATKFKASSNSIRIQGYKTGYSANKFDFKKTTFEFFYWLKKIPSFSFGHSSYFGERVDVIVAERLKNTVVLNAFSMFILLLFGIFLGIFSAVFKNAFLKIIEIFFFVIYAVPDFILAIFLILVFSLKLGLFPSSGMISIDHYELSFWGRFFDTLKHLFLPALSLSLSSIIFLARFTKNSIVGILENYHILALTVRGVDTLKNKVKHVLKNAIFPFISLFTFIIPGLLGGSIIVETIFGYPGIGNVFFTAVKYRDFPLLIAVSFINVAAVFFSIFVTDILYECFKAGDFNEKNT